MVPTTILLAKLAGPVVIITAIGILANLKKVEKLVKDLEKSYALMFIAGFFMVVLGMIMVTAHNIWNNIPAAIISVFGWATLLKGAVFMVIPDQIMNLAKKIIKIDNIYLLGGIVWLAIGVYLGYAGYFM